MSSSSLPDRAQQGSANDPVAMPAVRFTNIHHETIAAQLQILKEEKIKYEDDLIIHLSRLANGSMRDALSLLDQLISGGQNR